MAVNWYLDSALGVLYRQLKSKYPGMVIGTIGDASHQTNNPSSDHNPEADGSVDALDPMLGPNFTKANCEDLVTALVASRDFRIKYVIWERRIIYPTPRNGYDAWEWQPYHLSDPHTGHAHISRNDIDETNTALWRISMEQIPYPRWLALDDYSLPELKHGMNDKNYAGYDNIKRLQDLVGAVVDGDYGDDTAEAVAKRVSYGNGKLVGLKEWVTIYGLSNR